jgi:primosomal protein N' (replication factor Y) (superfamily II helicase)
LANTVPPLGRSADAKSGAGRTVFAASQSAWLRCHYYDYSQTPPELCPSCQGGNIHLEGIGTERLESELAERFPAARIARMDRDTTTCKGVHQSLMERMTR